MKGYNSLLGSHYDHYYIDYTDYDIEDIDPTVFKVDESKYQYINTIIIIIGLPQSTAGHRPIRNSQWAIDKRSVGCPQGRWSDDLLKKRI